MSAAFARLRDRVWRAILLGMGLGAAPLAPGTFGTLGGVLLAVPLGALLDGAALVLALSGIALGLFLVGCASGRAIVRLFGREDPGCVVLDEIVGYLAVVAIDAALHGRPGPWTHALAFVLFRIFDVLKLPPARRAEELPGGLGVMADDVVAAVQAAAGLWLLHAFGLP